MKVKCFFGISSRYFILLSLYGSQLKLTCYILLPIYLQISMNALLVAYLMNTNILLIIATLMQTVQIPKVHFIARARLDSLEMGSLASVSDNQCSTDHLDVVFKNY